MVFAGPPEADIDWADMSPGGSLKFLQRAWRLSGDVTSEPGHVGRGRRRRRCAGPPTARCATPSSWSRPSGSTCWSPASWSWSTPPARRSTPAAGRPTRPCARPPRRVAILLSLVAPYTAEEMWERLGHQPTVARAGWPTVDQALLVQDSVTAVVQIQGKLRAKLEVSPDISAADLEALAMADPHVQRALDGKDRPQGDRAGAQAGQHRHRLTGTGRPPSEAGQRRVDGLVPGEQVERAADGGVRAQHRGEHGGHVGARDLAAPQRAHLDAPGAGVVGEPSRAVRRSSRGRAPAGPRRRPAWRAGRPGTPPGCPGRPCRCPSRRPSRSAVRRPAPRRRRAARPRPCPRSPCGRHRCRARPRPRTPPRRRPCTTSATAATSACSRSSTTASAPAFSRSSTWSGLRTMPTARVAALGELPLQQQGDLAVSSGDDDAHGAPSRWRMVRTVPTPVREPP